MSDSSFNYFLEADAVEEQNGQSAQGDGSARRSLRSRLLHSFYAMPCLCLAGGILFVVLMRFLPEAAAAVGYPLGWLTTSLHRYRGHRHFVRPFVYSVLTIVLATPVALLWQFLSQTLYYSIFEYFSMAHAWASCLFQSGLCILLACVGVYFSLPAKKKNAPAEQEAEEQKGEPEKEQGEETRPEADDASEPRPDPDSVQ